MAVAARAIDRDVEGDCIGTGVGISGIYSLAKGAFCGVAGAVAGVGGAIDGVGRNYKRWARPGRAEVGRARRPKRRRERENTARI